MNRLHSFDILIDVKKIAFLHIEQYLIILTIPFTIIAKKTLQTSKSKLQNLKLSIHTNRISPSVASLTPSPGMTNRDLEKDSTLKCTLLNIKQPVS